MTDAPKRIWLQDDGDYEGARNSMAGTDTGVTWADTQINDNDSEYIRADLVPRWSSDMDAAPRDGTVILAVPWGPATGLEDVAPTYWIASEERWANWWWSSEPTDWMRVDPPKEEK